MNGYLATYDLVIVIQGHSVVMLKPETDHSCRNLRIVYEDITYVNSKCLVFLIKMKKSTPSSKVRTNG